MLLASSIRKSLDVTWVIALAGPAGGGVTLSRGERYGTLGGVTDAATDAALVRRAREALDGGSPWRARDLLQGYVAEHRDPTALALLGEVLHDMGDEPGAGAAWFGAGVRGPEVDAAIAAWREKHDDDFGDMWRSLPASVRRAPRSPKVDALRTKAMQADEARDSARREDPGAQDGMDAAQVISWVIAAVFVVCAVVGLITILGWIFPNA